jgi:hypothetical protein
VNPRNNTLKLSSHLQVCSLCSGEVKACLQWNCVVPRAVPAQCAFTESNSLLHVQAAHKDMVRINGMTCVQEAKSVRKRVFGL